MKDYGGRFVVTAPRPAKGKKPDRAETRRRTQARLLLLDARGNERARIRRKFLCLRFAASRRPHDDDDSELSNGGSTLIRPPIAPLSTLANI